MNRSFSIASVLAVALLAGTLFPRIAGARDVLIDPARSKIEIRVKATGHDFNGTLNRYRATASVNDAMEPTSGKLEWNFADLKTGNGRRDAKMLAWLGAPKFGGAAFTFSKWSRDAQGRTQVTGTLEIHGVKKGITFPASVSRTGGEVTVKGRTVIDHTDYQLPVITFFRILKVDPRVEVSFTVAGTLR